MRHAPLETIFSGRQGVEFYPGLEGVKPTFDPVELPATVNDNAGWHAGRLAGLCEERGRILDLLAYHAAHEYQGGWIRRLTDAIREGATAPREDPDQP